MATTPVMSPGPIGKCGDLDTHEYFNSTDQEPINILSKHKLSLAVINIRNILASPRAAAIMARLIEGPEDPPQLWQRDLSEPPPPSTEAEQLYCEWIERYNPEETTVDYHILQQLEGTEKDERYITSRLLEITCCAIHQVATELYSVYHPKPTIAIEDLITAGGPPHVLHRAHMPEWPAIYHPSYPVYQATRGLSTIGFWAEYHILGGIAFFDRRERADAECIWLQSTIGNIKPPINMFPGAYQPHAIHDTTVSPVMTQQVQNAFRSMEFPLRIDIENSETERLTVPGASQRNILREFNLGMSPVVFYNPHDRHRQRKNQFNRDEYFSWAKDDELYGFRQPIGVPGPATVGPAMAAMHPMQPYNPAGGLTLQQHQQLITHRMSAVAQLQAQQQAQLQAQMQAQMQAQQAQAQQIAAMQAHQQAASQAPPLRFVTQQQLRLMSMQQQQIQQVPSLQQPQIMQRQGSGAGTSARLLHTQPQPHVHDASSSTSQPGRSPVPLSRRRLGESSPSSSMPRRSGGQISAEGRLKSPGPSLRAESAFRDGVDATRLMLPKLDDDSEDTSPGPA